MLAMIPLRHTECACYIILAYSMQAGHLPKGEVARKRLSTILINDEWRIPE
jgi:hypothetical protein